LNMAAVIVAIGVPVRSERIDFSRREALSCNMTTV
jgi:hypothetical protein